MHNAEIHMEGNPEDARLSASHSRSSFPVEQRVGAFLALGVLAFAGLEPSVGGKLAITVAAVAILVVMYIFCRRWMSSPLQDAAILVTLIYVFGLFPVIGMWPIVGALSLALTAGIAWRRKSLRAWRGWFRLGRIDTAVWGWFAIIVVLTISGLLLWMFLFDGHLPEAYVSAARSVPKWQAAVGGAVFLIVNGIIEDAIFFGILLTATSGPLHQVSAVVVVAAAFGMAHFSGVPGSMIGVAMAGAWGAVLGLLRVRTDGMLATYLAHVLADATIMVVLLPKALH
jgi:membrane protease YdiL (CAAX protease family)